MQEKKAAGIFTELLLVVMVLGTLGAIAVPRIGNMIDRTNTVAQESELHNIQTAVVEMLCDSETRTLEPAGPTADMSEVLTSDTPPLVLENYLSKKIGALSTGCNYSFDAQGGVTQILP